MSSSSSSAAAPKAWETSLSFEQQVVVARYRAAVGGQAQARDSVHRTAAQHDLVHALQAAYELLSKEQMGELNQELQASVVEKPVGGQGHVDLAHLGQVAMGVVQNKGKLPTLWSAQHMQALQKQSTDKFVQQHLSFALTALKTEQDQTSYQDVMARLCFGEHSMQNLDALQRAINDQVRPLGFHCHICERKEPKVAVMLFAN